MVAQVTGIMIEELLNGGMAGDGSHAFVVMRANNKQELTLLFPYSQIGFLVGLLEKAASDCQKAQLARGEKSGSFKSDIVKLKNIGVTVDPDSPVPVLRLGTESGVPFAFEFPLQALKEWSASLPQTIASIEAGMKSGFQKPH